MNRDMFVRMATAVLHQMGDGAAAAKAEAIAVQMDMFAVVMEGSAPTLAAVVQPPVRTPFPSPNPESLVAPAPPPPPYDPHASDNLIVPATTIPDRIEAADARARMAASPEPPPLRSIRGVGRMKVEELSLLVQERTPQRISFDVPMEDGPARRMTYERNVISRHNEDSVQLIYSPPNVLQSAREAVEVQCAIHIDDLPVDLAAILKQLTEQAVSLLRPRGQVVSQAPPVNMGAVKHAGDTYIDPAMAAQTQAVFTGIG